MSFCQSHVFVGWSSNQFLSNGCLEGWQSNLLIANVVPGTSVTAISIQQACMPTWTMSWTMWCHGAHQLKPPKASSLMSNLRRSCFQRLRWPPARHAAGLTIASKYANQTQSCHIESHPRPAESKDAKQDLRQEANTASQTDMESSRERSISSGRQNGRQDGSWDTRPETSWETSAGDKLTDNRADTASHTRWETRPKRSWEGRLRKRTQHPRQCEKTIQDREKNGTIDTAS